VIIADTGYWLALANPKDRHHARAVEVTRGLQEALVTTWPVLTEACHLLVSRLGPDAGRSFLRGIENGAAELWTPAQPHWGKIIALMAKYADLPMDLADATLVLLAEHLGHGRILSTDTRDFRTYRWKQRKPFRNLLL